jgi:hypothetical protein
MNRLLIPSIVCSLSAALIFPIGATELTWAPGRTLLLAADQTPAPRAPASREPSAAPTDRDLADALLLAKSGKYPEAAKRLFDLSYSPRFAAKRMQIKYILGLALHQMKLNQVAAFQFIGVIKEGGNAYVKQSLKNLSLAANSLGDDTLLNYAISRINVDEFPRVHRDMLHFRIGEYESRNKQYLPAAKSFGLVQGSSELYGAAKYQQALAFAEAGQPDRALTSFDDIERSREGQKITDKVKVAAMMGKARTLYQKQKWDEAIEMYRSIPRDSEYWHDTLFESSWAMLRSGRFRSALSNFHSLHSAFYENTYLPESLLLRAIVYLYICKYDEMNKVLNLFSKIYKPVYTQVSRQLDSNPNPTRYFNVMNDIIRQTKGGEMPKASLEIPYVVAQKITREADFQNSFQYIRQLLAERKRVTSIGGNWANSPVGRYSIKILNTRIAKAKERAGKIVRNHLVAVRDELVDQIEQEGFARYEMLNGRKENIKKKMAGKELEKQVDDDNRRSFYIQNGYEYWPFRGEYWLDELGNYHYVGTQSCN